MEGIFDPEYAAATGTGQVAYVEPRRPRRPVDSVIRQPRQAEVRPLVSEGVADRRPQRILSTSSILFFGFVAFIIAGGLLLALPISSSEGTFTSLELAFFTATSAATVTGQTVVNTATYWSTFGQAVIFFLMLVGGLSFMAVATFVLTRLGQSTTMSDSPAMQSAIGLERLGRLLQIARNITLVVFLIYLIGAAAILWRIHGMDGMSLSQSVWHSVFLSVSSFNNAGFSILPESPAGSGLERIATERFLLGFMMALIILGSIGWTVLVDLYHHGRFARLSLNTKLVLATSLFLWILGAGVFFLAEFSNTIENLSLGDKVVSSVFHSVSGRTAGFATMDFQDVKDFTKLTFPALMFIGGGAGSVAGGIKVNAFAVIIAAVISSIRGRPRPEAFGREIARDQVSRALTVAVLGVVFIVVVMPILTLTEPNIAFLDLLFETISAFSTNGTSVGIVPDLSLAGKILLMAAMFIGRLGPLILALALAPRERTVYRFVEERVTIG